MVKFQRGFKARANDIALGLRKQAGLAQTAPLDPRDVFQRLSIQIVPLSQFLRACPTGTQALLSNSGRFSAMLLPVGQGKRIVIHNDSHSSRRQVSNLAHELAHVLLVHAAEVVCTGDLSRRADSLVEAEAAYLGGCILVPNEAAYRIAFSGLDSHTAAKSYGVSEEMITYRLRMSGALKRAQRSA
ncbi:MAG: ImmA/IrrE family metallo-endopeptidase [Chloroflexi bacterium]|nr:ImmA/IrrE family metallo-endopeptidase [Chloroflexota bacterium]